MVDAVNTVQNSTPPLRQVPQGNSNNGGNVESARASQDFTVSSIRIDSKLDLVILEFKSAETGDVLRQYPTERQIRTIQRVAQLENNKQEVQAVQASVTTVSPTFEGGSDVGQSIAPVTVSVPSAPTTAATSVNTTQGTTASVSDSSSVSSSSTSTQSVTV